MTIGVGKQLDDLGVPNYENGKMLSLWERVQIFGSEFEKYRQELPFIRDRKIDKVLQEELLLKPVVEKKSISEKKVEKPFVLTKDQQNALAKINIWAKSDDKFFLLAGYAGSGKTRLLLELKKLDRRYTFSALTNKAAKVLGKVLDEKTKTIHSLLGLRLSDELGEDLELVFPKIPPEIPKNAIIVIDEASMCSTQLFEFIKKINLKFILVGDPAQIPPVGEISSPCFSSVKKKACKAVLKEVVRHDNQILKAATAIRNNLIKKEYTNPLIEDNDGNEGVWVLSKKELEQKIIECTKIPNFWANAKIIAWRNKTCRYWNSFVRKQLGFTGDYAIGDFVVLSSPIEKNGYMVASTDEEGVIIEIEESIKQIEHIEVPIYDLLLNMGDRNLSIAVPRGECEVFDKLLFQKAERAKQLKGFARRDAWKDFWRCKNQIYKGLLSAYAITGHRSQGSSIPVCFIMKSDILVNQTKREAYKILYTCVSRASKQLYIC